MHFVKILLLCTFIVFFLKKNRLLTLIIYFRYPILRGGIMYCVRLSFIYIQDAG